MQAGRQAGVGMQAGSMQAGRRVGMQAGMCRCRQAGRQACRQAGV